MNRRTSFALSFALAMLVPALLFAQMGGMKGGCGHGWMGLGLDDEQQMKMEKLSLEHRLATIDLRAEQAKLRLEMKQEMLEDEPSRKVLEKFAKSIAANREKMQMKRIDHMLDVKKVLTTEQWKNFVRHHCDRMGRRGDRGHRSHACMTGKRMKGDRDGCMMKHRDGSCREPRFREKRVDE
jgi:Spy/CpxP family protein refolding chaperone